MGIKILLNVIILSIVCLFPSAQSASFNCNKAFSEAERLICGDAKLSERDEDLAHLYKKILHDSANQNQLRAQQRRWLKDVHARCHSTACLISEYDKRIEQLFRLVPSTLPLSGTFECTLSSLVDNEIEFKSRELLFKVRDGRIIDFDWSSTWAPKSDDLRPGFHYTTRFALRDMRQKIHAEYVALEIAPVTGQQNDQSDCRVVLSQDEDKLSVYTEHCNGPETSIIDETFFHNGSVCYPQSFPDSPR